MARSCTYCRSHLITPEISNTKGKLDKRHTRVVGKGKLLIGFYAIIYDGSKEEFRSFIGLFHGGKCCSSQRNFVIRNESKLEPTSEKYFFFFCCYLIRSVRIFLFRLSLKLYDDAVGFSYSIYPLCIPNGL